MINKRFSKFELTLAALGGVVILFITAPLLSMFLKSFNKDLADAAIDHAVIKSIAITLSASMGATVISALFAIPLAYILARKNFPLKGLINGIIDVPVVIPHSAAGIALLGILSSNGVIGKTGEALGIHFVGGFAGIMVAMAFVSIPYLVNSARDGFSMIPLRVEQAALNLGASPARMFLTVPLPIAKKSIISGLIMMWARGMSEFGAVLIIAYFPMTTPVLIFERFTSYGLKYARPVSVLFVLICLLFFVLFRLASGENKNAGN